MFIDLQSIDALQRQHWLSSAITPRPIALASTTNRKGQPNLAPFSFFNLFSYDPPIVIFSTVRRLRDNTTKHTLDNLYFVPEVVIHVCDVAMVQQQNIASADFPEHVSEFEKAGFSALPSLHVRPPRVAEAKVALECRVKEIKPLGTNGGAGTLIIAEVLCMHIDDTVLTNDRAMIDPLRLQAIARLGGDDYVRVNRQNCFPLKKMGRALPIGFDGLPESVRSSAVLTGNQLGRLAACHTIPVRNEQFNGPISHERAALLIDLGLIDEAWQTLLHHDHVTLHTAG